MGFSEKIKEMRKLNNLSQAQIAYKLGIERSTVAHWESGKSAPNYEVIGNLADMFEVTVDFLVGKTSVPMGEVVNADSLKIMRNTVPVYGRIPAGTPFEAIEDKLEDVSIPDYLAKKKGLFGLKIDGESMNKIIPNGAIGVFEKTCQLENGEIGAIMVSGYDATVKKFYQLTDSVLLEPVSYEAKYEPMIIKEGSEEVQVIGRLVWYCAPHSFK